MTRLYRGLIDSEQAAGAQYAEDLGKHPPFVGAQVDAAVESFAGVANPFSLRHLLPSGRVVDIGSGGDHYAFRHGLPPSLRARNRRDRFKRDDVCPNLNSGGVTGDQRDDRRRVCQDAETQRCRFMVSNFLAGAIDDCSELSATEDAIGL